MKGSDKFLFDLLCRTWPCRFLPVLVVDEAREDVGDDADIEYSSFSRNVYAFTKQDFNYYTGALDAKPDHALKSAVPFMWYGPELPGRVLHQHHSAGGRQGNHAEPSEDQTVYMQSAMLVDLSRKV
ncbi:hypothetical protein KFL_001720105 [Klebsormidium nitens]|uniref:Uncharacterized protein n=1 Tax=Klebsormidium nitens TaxID=105231 RepID=A0A0U9HJZ0_KLENI|nr:hypothetical protein KFL_001720105 [Klebsormidium nitens]|eukprot:GAQ83998.1 hypothetical protein KFL_001720105 [Klebsormidium nitens]